MQVHIHVCILHTYFVKIILEYLHVCTHTKIEWEICVLKIILLLKYIHI